MKQWHFDARPTASQLAEIADSLLGGGVLLMPTDTIYGLHALAGNELAAARIAALKGRGVEKRFLVLAGSTHQIEALGASVPPGLEDIWPAPLTAILQQGEPNVAVRIPAVDWLLELLAMTGPLISTSANRTGEPPVSEPQLLSDEMRMGIDGWVDGGTRSGEPSTIVDFTGPSPRIVREGAFAFTQKLRKTLRKWL